MKSPLFEQMEARVIALCSRRGGKTLNESEQQWIRDMPTDDLKRARAALKEWTFGERALDSGEASLDLLRFYAVTEELIRRTSR